MNAGSHEDYVLVAAIDFGTTFSGYAFSFKPVGDEEPPIYLNKSWGAGLGFATYKTSTSVLLHHTGELDSFGFEAEKKYSEGLDDEGIEVDRHLFRHFKMILHKADELKLTTTIPSVDGTEMQAVNVFGAALAFLKTHLLKTIQDQNGSEVPTDSIRWVITVPAIWGEKSKQFMRHAAEKAGCVAEKDSRNLYIALEPEAASLCCRRLKIAQFACKEAVSFPPGTKYIVLDCGGGTIDVTAHELNDEEQVREILRASGGPWGGTEVDKRYLMLMESILGKAFMECFKREYPNQWLQFITEFEKRKKGLKDEKSTIAVPLIFVMDTLYRETYKGASISEAFVKSYDKGVQFRNGNIVLSSNAVKGIFEPVIKSTVNHIGELMKNPKLDGVKYILMVGGFSECSLLQNAIKLKFESEFLKVLIPAEAQMAIIRGAVLFGHNPQEIQSRVARRTYGCAVLDTFDPKRHDKSRAFEDTDGITKCDDIFYPLVAKGDEVTIENEIKRHFRPWENQISISFKIYATDEAVTPEDNVRYIDDPTMQKLGIIVLNDIATGENRLVELCLKFGTTEIQTSALELSSKREESIMIDFLS